MAQIEKYQYFNELHNRSLLWTIVKLECLKLKYTIALLCSANYFVADCGLVDICYVLIHHLSNATVALGANGLHVTA